MGFGIRRSTETLLEAPVERSRGFLYFTPCSRALHASLAMNIAPLVPYLFLGSFFSLLLLALWVLWVTSDNARFVASEGFGARLLREGKDREKSCWKGRFVSFASFQLSNSNAGTTY